MGFRVPLGARSLQVCVYSATSCQIRMGYRNCWRPVLGYRIASLLATAQGTAQKKLVAGRMRFSGKIIFGAVTISAIVANGAGFAADTPVKLYAKAPPAPVVDAVYNWSGFYAGVNAGAAWGSYDPVDIVRARWLFSGGGPRDAQRRRTSKHQSQRVHRWRASRLQLAVRQVRCRCRGRPQLSSLERRRQ